MSTDKLRRKCANCFRLIKGHPKPCGQLCKLDPLLSEEERKQEKQKRLEIDRKRKTTPECKEATRKRMATPKNKEADRKRKATPKNKEANRKRMATDKNRKNDLLRKHARLEIESYAVRVNRLEAMRKSKILAKEKKRKLDTYKAWCDPSDDSKPEVGSLSIPKMNMVCSHCNALMFPFEKTSNDKETFSLCCGNGNVSLPSITDPPELLQKLLTSKSQNCEAFRDNIRGYNSLLSMASRNITGEKTYFGNSRGPPIFKISGSMFHLTPNVLPDPGQTPKFSQIYIYDSKQQVEERMKHCKTPKSINKNLLEELQGMLFKCNFYVKQYQAAADVFASNPTEDLRLVIKSKGSKEAQKKTFMPDVSDVVVIAPGDQTEPRDVVLYKSKAAHPNGNDTVRIDELHKSYDPTAYVLILPNGDDGYSLPPPLKNNGRQLTAMDFYSFHLMVRESCFNTLHRSGRLFQEYVCDMYCKVEGARLKFLLNNQDKLRVELYSGLQDAVTQSETGNESEVARIGQMIVLPASFTGSPRYMYKHYLERVQKI